MKLCRNILLNWIIAKSVVLFYLLTIVYHNFNTGIVHGNRSSTLLSCCVRGSSTLGQTLVTVLPSSVTLRYSAGLNWDYNRNHLLYVDRSLKQIHVLDFTSGQDAFITTDKMPSFILPTKGFDHRFIIGQGTDVVYLFWPYDTASSYHAQCLIVTLDYDCPGNNLNDARADAYGRIWTATYTIPDLNNDYPDDLGTLYRIDTRTPGKAEVDAVIRPVTFGNDLVWTRDNNIFYFVDTDTSCVYSYNFDLINGVICCGQTVFCLADFNITGRLDGITIDWNDDLWIAAPFSGLVLNVNPNTKQLMRTVTIPCEFIIDVAFGGTNLDILFVSTKYNGEPLELLCGSIFQVTGLGVRGIPENYAVMNSDCTPEYFGAPTDISN